MTEHSSAIPLESTDERVLEQLAGVSRRSGLVPLEARLLRLQRWLRRDLRDLEGALADVLSPLDGGANSAMVAARHLLAQPGKRVRPLCVVLAARLGGRALHDDVIDVGPERRGKPAAWVVTSNAASILGGDHLLVEALRRVHGVGRPGLSSALLDAISSMIAAEALQLERRGRFEPDRRAYLDVIRGKTAVLFRWCLLAGGTLGGLGEPELAALSDAGLALGLAFQLVDDVLDLSGDVATLGKEPFADLREGKLTWPVILACERDPDLIVALRRFVEGGPVDGAALAARIRDLGALEETRALATLQAHRARERLSALPAGKPRRALETVVEAATHRAA
jgi:octaprenyl-diphosphate synthase